MKTKNIKDKIKRFFKNKKSLFITIPVAIFTIYTTFGFFGVPLIAEKIVPYFLKKKDIYLKIDNLKFNPFTYECNITGFDLQTFSPLFKVKQIDTKLNVKKLFEKSINIEILRFSKPDIHILKEHNATFNFDQFSSSESSSKDENKTAFFNIILDHIQIIDGSLAYDDRSLIDPFDIKFDNIDYEIQGVNLLEKTIGQHIFGANSDTIKNIQWNGGIDINPLEIYGRLNISDLKISPFWISFLEKQNLKVEQGTINSTINYNMVIDNNISILLQDSNLTLSRLVASDGNETFFVDKLDIPRINLEAELAKEKNATLKIDEIAIIGLDYDSKMQIDNVNVLDLDIKFDADTNTTLSLNLDSIIVENSGFRNAGAKYALHNLLINKIHTAAQIDGNFTDIKTDLNEIKFDDFFFRTATKDGFGGGFGSFVIENPTFEYTLLQNDTSLSILMPDNNILGLSAEANLTKLNLDKLNFKDFSLKMALNDGAMLLKSGGSMLKFDKFIVEDDNKTIANIHLNELEISSPTFELNSIENRQNGAVNFGGIVANKLAYATLAGLETLAVSSGNFNFINNNLEQNFTLNGGLDNINLNHLYLDNNQSQKADIAALTLIAPTFQLVQNAQNTHLNSNIKNLDINQTKLTLAPEINSLTTKNSIFSDINLKLYQEQNQTNIDANLHDISVVDFALISKTAKTGFDKISISGSEIKTKNSDFNATLQSIKLVSPKASFDKFNINLDTILLSKLNAHSQQDSILAKLSDLNTTKISAMYNNKNLSAMSSVSIHDTHFSTDKNALLLGFAHINLGKTDIFSDGKVFAGASGANLKELKFDINKNSLNIGDITITTPKFESIINEKGVAAINNFEILNRKSSGKSTSNINPLKFNIKNAKLVGGEVKISENFSSQYLNHTINKINFEAQNISSTSPNGFNFKANANSSDSVSLKTSGAIKLDPFSADLNLNIDATDLTKFNPFMQQFLDGKITSGKVSYSGKVGFSDNLNLNGKASLSNLNIKDQKNIDFFAIKSLDLNTLTLKNNTLNIDKIYIKSPFLKAAIAKDKSFNITDMIKKTDSKPSTSNKKSDFKFKLSNISLEDGNMDFSDHSLFLPFDIKVAKLKTTVDTISDDSPANIKLSGVVGERGLSQITVNTLPFTPKNKTEFTMIYKDIELKNITPYSAKFVGYEIKNGRANLNLHYTINDSKLSAKNEVNLDALQLGKKIESTDAVDLPLELAISVLKDSNDQINISLPVSGDLNDPKFSYGGIVFGAITKLFADVVLSPFRLIGNILGIDAEKLNGVDFTAGSDEILDSELPKLEDLKKIALAKPEIRLTITPSYSKKIDTYAYQKSYLDSEIALLMNKDGLSYNAAIKSLKAKYASSFQGSQEALINELVAAKKFTESKLDDLAEDRAKAIKNELEDMGVSSEQISIKDVKNVSPKQDTFITLEIGVENR